jgi:cell division protein FtsN
MAAVWLARLKAKGQDAAVCSVIRSVNEGTNPETVQYFRSEQQRVCGSIATAPRTNPAPAPRAAAENRAPDKPAAAQPTAVTGRVTIQVGAFRELSGARGIQRQLENAGFADVRLVRVPGNQLIRVRIGKYENRAAAAATLARLANANFSAVLVTDANVETRVTN